ncbi:MAG TPA: DNA-formamidopyrimidine glycosylase [Tenericutes bacterium]|nr:DNA-formamidopyrimidine glycosylase [Mycoplasmatota bacterium]
MPELPEVETVKETLKRKLINKVIEDVNVYYERIIEFPDVESFKKMIKNQKIKDINRRGKWLIFELDDYYLLSHLRMEGKYIYRKVSEPLSKHEHVSFNIGNDTELRYMDTRKFGKMHLVIKEDLLTRKPISELGLEPWDKDLNISYLKNKYKNKKLPIKTVILDQSIIVGIGNIYADEILFLSKINPYKKASELSNDQLLNIIKYTKFVLEKAIKLGGTTIKSYESSEGVHGKFQNELLIHGKQKEECPNCNDIIIKVKIGGRGTYYCPTCQKDSN